MFAVHLGMLKGRSGRGYDSLGFQVPAGPPATKLVREVFVEDPDTAVAVARCASFLDPLYVLPHTNGSRNWGVFQISDRRLSELGGTPLRAFHPEWNIKAAHRLWSAEHDFHDWPSCQAALKNTPES